MFCFRHNIIRWCRQHNESINQNAAARFLKRVLRFQLKSDNLGIEFFLRLQYGINIFLLVELLSVIMIIQI